MVFISSVKQTWFSDPEEPNSIPLIVIHAANDPIEGNQLEESCDLAEPIVDNNELADAIENPDVDVEKESLLNGKSKSFFTLLGLSLDLLLDIKNVFLSYKKFHALYIFHATSITIKIPK